MTRSEQALATFWVLLSVVGTAMAITGILTGYQLFLAGALFVIGLVNLATLVVGPLTFIVGWPSTSEVAKATSPQHPGPPTH